MEAAVTKIVCRKSSRSKTLLSSPLALVVKEEAPSLIEVMSFSEAYSTVKSANSRI